MYSREYESEWMKYLEGTRQKIPPRLSIKEIKNKIIQLFTKNTAHCGYKNISIMCEFFSMIEQIRYKIVKGFVLTVSQIEALFWGL